MAEAGLGWPGRLVVGVLILGALATEAQSGPQHGSGAGGSIAGRLTDVGSTPLVGTTVVARNQVTGAETKTITSKNGSYRLSGLQAGQYTLEAQSARLGRGRLEGIYVAGGGYEARVQAAMAFVPAPAIVLASPRVVAPTAAVVGAAIVDVKQLGPASGALVAMSIAGASLRALPPTNWTTVGGPTRSPLREAPSLSAGLATVPLQRLALIGHPVTGLTPNGALAANMAALSAARAAIGLKFDTDEAHSANAGRADPAAEAVQSVLTGKEVAALPAAGRRWEEFVLDAPTAATSAGGTAGLMLRGAGQEPGTQVDGANTRAAFGGTGDAGPRSSGPGANGQGGREQNGMGQAWAGGRGPGVAAAAIREVTTAAGNAEANAGRSAGGVVSIETARGGNGLHGQAFLFDRQNTWGAKNPFTQWVKQTTSATLTTFPIFTAEAYTPPDHEEVWGFGVGSRIRRDKLFWFGALDGYDRNDPGLATVKHPDEFFAQPSNDQMQVLAARLALSPSNPVAEGLAAYSPVLTTLDGLLGPAPRRAAQWTGFGRLDWEATERHRFTLEGTGAHWNAPGGGLTRVSETYGANSFGSSEASEYRVLGRWQAFVSPNLLAVTQGSLGRTAQSAHADTPSDYEKTLLGPNVWGQLPQMTVDSRYGFTIGNPSRFGAGSYPDEHVYQALEGIDWVRRSLLVRAGFDVSHNGDTVSLLRNQTGTYHYTSVENFASDALAFAKYGIAGQLNPRDQHNCDETGRAWRDTEGTLHGLGYLPCYSYYSQEIGPTDWSLSTNDWAGFATAQWQPAKLVVVSGGLRWERQQLPPPIAAMANTELPLTQKLPSLGNNWGPRVSVAVGSLENHWPVLRLGYGMYYGRAQNSTIETALSQTGSANGDLSYFLRPTDNLHAGGAPPFPYVLAGAPASFVKPGAVEFASGFRNAEIHQAVGAIEEELPAHVLVTASGLVSLGRRLPISIDTNFDSAVNPGTITYAVEDATGLGPIKTQRITVPFYASWPSPNCPAGSKQNSAGQCGRLNPDFQQVSAIMSRANSTYEAGVLRVDRYGRRGVSLHAHYTYAHAMDWNPNESTLVAGSDVLDPALFGQEYGTSNLDVRHSAAVMAVVESPWKVSGRAAQAANGWMISGIGNLRSGLPYTMRTSGSLAEEFTQPNGAAIVGLAPGMNGSGGDNRVYGVGRNTYRYPATWKADLRVGKKFDLGRMRQLELLVESFNLFNHQNTTQLETTGYYIQSGTSSGELPTLNFLTGTKANTTAFGQPLNINATNFYRERQLQIGARMRF